MEDKHSCGEVRHQAILGPEDEDQKDEVLFGRFVRWRSWGIEWEADVKHGKLLLERFGLDGSAKAMSVNGEWEIGCRLLARNKTLMCSPMRPKRSVQQSRD